MTQYLSAPAQPNGSRDGAVVRALASNQCLARVQFRPGVICGLSLLLVLVLAPRVFLRVLRCYSLHKNSNSNSTRVMDPHDNQRGLMWLPL